MRGRGPLVTQKSSKSRTPLVTPGCRITGNFLAGSQEMPFVPCPHCSTMQILSGKTSSSRSIRPTRIARASLASIAVRLSRSITGRRCFAASSGVRQIPPRRASIEAFGFGAHIRIFRAGRRLPANGCEATGDPAGEKTFSNDVLGKAYETRGDGRPWEELRDRALKSDYVRGQVPKGCLLLFLGLRLSARSYRMGAARRWRALPPFRGRYRHDRQAYFRARCATAFGSIARSPLDELRWQAVGNLA